MNPMQTTDTPSNVFSSLPLDQDLQTTLQRIGLEQTTPVQAEVIPLALQKKDLLVSAQTGSGKTIAFLLPLLNLILTNSRSQPGIRALVLVPTRELARQITNECKALAESQPIKIGMLIGGEDYKYQQAMFRRNPDIVIATPGRVIAHLELQTENLTHVEHLVLDEADRMLDLGLQEDVLKISGLSQNEKRQTMLFSATLTHPGVQTVAKRLMIDPINIELQAIYDAHPDIEQQLITCDDFDHKFKVVNWLLTHETFDKGLIFTNTKARADKLRGPLLGKKHRVAVLHGGVDQSERNRVMSLFREGLIKTIIATDVVARGIDVKGIELVINFDIPRNGHDYVHRIGRTGRAGEQGRAISLVSSTEWNLLNNIKRYLALTLAQRTIKDVEGHFHGPKKTKSSGKAAGKKKHSKPKKEAVKKIKVRHRDRKNIGKRRQPSTKQQPEVNDNKS